MAISLKCNSLWTSAIFSKVGKAPMAACYPLPFLVTPESFGRYFPNFTLFLPITKLLLGCGDMISFQIDGWVSVQPLSSFSHVYLTCLPTRGYYFVFPSLYSDGDFHFCRNIWILKLLSQLPLSLLFKTSNYPPPVQMFAIGSPPPMASSIYLLSSLLFQLQPPWTLFPTKLFGFL